MTLVQLRAPSGSLAQDALRIDLQQHVDAMVGLLGDLGCGHLGNHILVRASTPCHPRATTRSQQRSPRAFRDHRPPQLRPTATPARWVSKLAINSLRRAIRVLLAPANHGQQRRIVTRPAAGRGR